MLLLSKRPLVLLLLLGLVVSKSSALKCYQCKDVCGDSKGELVECTTDTRMPGGARTFFDTPELNETLNARAGPDRFPVCGKLQISNGKVARVCSVGLSGVYKDGCQDPVDGTHDGDKVKLTVCFCKDKDGCNGADSLASSIFGIGCALMSLYSHFFRF